VAQTWTRHTYEAWRPRPTLSYAGHDIERAPHTITNLRVRLKPAGLNGANATAEWQRIGRYWEDPENTHPYEGHSLINLNGNVPLKWGVTAVLRIVNVTNTHYAESATFTAAELEQLTPGAPRLIYIGAQRSWPR
jgi:hypothetical protein